MAGQTIGKVVAGGKTHTVTSTFYGTCATAAATAAKEVIINETNTTEALSFINGMTLAVKFTNANGVADPTLTVFNNSGTAASPTKGSTTLLAAKSIKKYGTTSPGTNAAGSWTAGAVVLFIYDGTNWIEASAWDNNTTYSNASLGQGYGTCTTAAGTAAKTVTLSSYALTVGGVVAVKFSKGVTVENPTLNVNSKGAKPIFWHGAALTDTTYIKANDVVTFIYDGTNYHIISKDIAFTLNKQTTAVSSFPTTATTSRDNKVDSTDYMMTITSVTALNDSTALTG